MYGVYDVYLMMCAYSVVVGATFRALGQCAKCDRNTTSYLIHNLGTEPPPTFLSLASTQPAPTPISLLWRRNRCSLGSLLHNGQQSLQPPQQPFEVSSRAAEPVIGSCPCTSSATTSLRSPTAAATAAAQEAQESPRRQEEAPAAEELRRHRRG